MLAEAQDPSWTISNAHALNRRERRVRRGECSFEALCELCAFRRLISLRFEGSVRSEVGPGDAVVPGELVFVEECPSVT
jgi:hypothetical protein